ncbi:RDD family protein [Candidatus Poriferisodalis sp.]|uniref:RDD family protein n=1 Tax=Candidatus Poriferisodalis sp. TaxID=3101277 RepID=UPI003B01725D
MTTAPLSSPEPGVEFARPRRRLWGWFVDMLVTGPIAIVGSIVWGLLAIIDQGFWCGEPGSAGIFSECEEAGVLSGVGLAVAVCAYVLAALYEPVCVAVRGRTLGRRAARIEVVRCWGAGRVGLGRSAVRWLVPLAPFAVCAAVELGTRHWRPALGHPLGWLSVSFAWWVLVHASVLWNSELRGWHDRLAGTVVVTKASALSLCSGPSAN